MDQGLKVKIPDSCLNSSTCEFTWDERHTLFQFHAFQQVYQSSPAPVKYHSSFRLGSSWIAAAVLVQSIISSASCKSIPATFNLPSNPVAGHSDWRVSRVCDCESPSITDLPINLLL